MYYVLMLLDPVVTYTINDCSTQAYLFGKDEMTLKFVKQSSDAMSFSMSRVAVAVSASVGADIMF